MIDWKHVEDCDWKVLKAARLSQEGHRGQKYGVHDYYKYHILGVIAMFNFLFGSNQMDEVTECCIYMHDLIEDTNVAHHNIMAIFGQDITNRLFLLTHEKKLETYDQYISSILRAHPDTIRIKIADMTFNLLESFKENDQKRIDKYVKYLPQLWKALEGHL